MTDNSIVKRKKMQKNKQWSKKTTHGQLWGTRTPLKTGGKSDAPEVIQI